MLQAGWSAADITPPEGVDLSGFGGRAGPNVGVHDRLSAKAVCISDGRARVALVTADLIGLDAATVAEVRAEIARRMSEAAPEVMIACSHTHSGPATPCLPALGRTDPDYFADLKERLATVVVEACGRLREAEVGYAQGEVLVGINRRERRTDGSTVLGRNKAGTVAPYVEVVRFGSEAGSALLFSHAAHAVTLGGDNLLVSGDWPGYAQRFVEAACGDCLALFAQGCCGDINSDPRGSFEIAEQQGRTVAEAVTRTAPAARSVGDGPVGSVSEVLALPLQDPPPEAEARAFLERAEQQLAAGEGIDNYGTRLGKEGMVDWGRRILALARAKATNLTRPFEVQVLRVGELALVGLPGEVFVEFQQELKARSPFPHTLVFAYANGNIGYVPTAAAYPEGGYEVDGAIYYYGDTMLKPESEQVLLDGACALLRKARATA